MKMHPEFTSLSFYIKSFCCPFPPCTVLYLSLPPLGGCSPLPAAFPNSSHLHSANPQRAPQTGVSLRTSLVMFFLCLRMALKVFKISVWLSSFCLCPIPSLLLRLLMVPRSQLSDILTYQVGGVLPWSFPDDCSPHWSLTYVYSCH